jgi:hypothetical protein
LFFVFPSWFFPPIFTPSKDNNQKSFLSLDKGPFRLTNFCFKIGNSLLFRINWWTSLKLDLLRNCCECLQFVKKRKRDQGLNLKKLHLKLKWANRKSLFYQQNLIFIWKTIKIITNMSKINSLVDEGNFYDWFLFKTFFITPDPPHPHFPWQRQIFCWAHSTWEVGGRRGVRMGNLAIIPST